MGKIDEILLQQIFPSTPVFTTAEVADKAEVSVSSASRRLKSLKNAGSLIRIRRGLWAMPNHPDFSPYAVVPHLFEGENEGYVSLLSALHLHEMIEQIPRTVHVVTQSQRPDLSTPVAYYEFHKMQPDLFGGYGPYDRRWSFQIAAPAKALFDTFYLASRRGNRFARLPELSLTEEFDRTEFDNWVNRVELAPLRTAILERSRDALESSTL